MAVSFPAGTTLVEVFPTDQRRSVVVGSDGTVAIDLEARAGSVFTVLN